MDNPGSALRQAIETEKPLQIAGVINAYAALLAEHAQFKAIYLSGAGIANANFALPDLGITSLNDVLDSVEKITAASTLPLLVDVDTGWGSPLIIRRAFRLISRANAAGAHLEDQQDNKRCGHREAKRLVSTQEMVGRIKAALDGRENNEFMIMARTDAISVEGEKQALERAIAYENAGADAIFMEAVTALEQYHYFSSHLNVPLLANMTEFGKTPLFSIEQLKAVGVAMVLYPLSAFRAMNYAAFKVYKTIKQQGSQQSVIDIMQNRQELYQFLNYEVNEQELEAYLQLMEKGHGK